MSWLSVYTQVKPRVDCVYFDQQDPDIKFTIELENNHNLSLLDVLITKQETKFLDVQDVLIGNRYPQNVIEKVISRRKTSGKTKSSAPKIEEDKSFFHYLILRALLTF